MVTRMTDELFADAQKAPNELSPWTWLRAMNAERNKVAELEAALKAEKINHSKRMDDKRLMVKSLHGSIAKLQATIERMELGLKAVQELIGDSEGVYGLHLNGDCAPWETLQTGGQFEEWLLDFDKALGDKV